MMFKIGSAVVGILLMASSVSFAQDNAFDPQNPQIDAEQLKCMVMNMYHEARGESDKGMIAVGYVTLNRVKSKLFPDTICDVVHQAVYWDNGVPKRHLCQFSWWCDGKDDKADEMMELRAAIINHSLEAYKLDIRVDALDIEIEKADAKHKPGLRKAKLYIQKKIIKLKDRIIQLRARLAVWLRAVDLAEKVILKEVKDPTHGALYYHADYVTPSWVTKFRETGVIGRHIFYALRKS